MDLETKIKTYHNLDQLSKNARERADKLKEEIKEELGEGSHAFGEYRAVVQIKDRTKIDLEAAAQILTDKGLVQCFELVPNPDWIEQAYLEGALSDADLRDMRKPQYSVALKTERILPDVQS